ncbi:MAG: ATP-grasp domain-containing protein [Anaerolineae bacterium]|nr:ATP-grasp domain-containing protein [Anaerolineae bacterium]
MKVLVTGVGGPAGRHVSQLLGQHGYEVIGVDRQPVCLPGLAAFHQAPATCDPAYVAWLANTAVTADLLIPTMPEELLKVAAAQDVLPCPALIASVTAVSAVHDQYATAQTLAAANLPVPRFARPSALTTAADVRRRVGWPCLSRPRFSRSRRCDQGVTVYETPADFPALAAHDDSYMVQEFVPGAQYAVSLFLDKTATVVAVMGKTDRCERANGRAADVRQVTAPDVAATAVAAARALGLTGPLHMDIRRRADGCPVVLEINARFEATIAYAPEVLLLAVNREP